MKILSTLRTHIPAERDTYIIEPVYDGARLDDRKVVGTVSTPVIAWLVTTDIVETDCGGDSEGQSASSPIALGGLAVCNVDFDDGPYVLTVRGKYWDENGEPLGSLEPLEYFTDALAKRATARHMAQPRTDG